MSKPRGVERYVVLATAESPRMMLREGFQNGLVTELVSAQESER
jgi:hypothetical protein